MGATTVKNQPCLRTESELSCLEELLDVVLSFDFFDFILGGGCRFLLVVSESAVIVKVSALEPEPSYPTCSKSREFRLVERWQRNNRRGGVLWWGYDGGGVDGLVPGGLFLFRLLHSDHSSFLFPPVSSSLFLPLQYDGGHRLLLFLAGFSFFLSTRR